MLPETHPLIETVTKPLADNAEQAPWPPKLSLRKNSTPIIREWPIPPRVWKRAELKFPMLRKSLPWILAAIGLATVITYNSPTFRFAKMVL